MKKVCALLAASQVADAAFAPCATPHCSRPAVQPLAANPQMVSAKEVYGQLYEASPPVQKSLEGLPSPVAKGAMAGVVAVTGAAGFILTPSRRLAVNAVGGALTASIGNIARKRLSDERQKAAVPAVAALLSQGLASATPENLAAIASEYSVPKKQFETMLGELYLAYLSATLTTHEVATAELSELIKLQDLLKLSAAQAGTQVYAAARQLYSRHRAYLEDPEPSDSKLLLQKFVFLAERVLAKDDSPEGYRYETLRLQKLFSLTQPEWRAMAEAAAVPFYSGALNKAVIDKQPVTAQQLGEIRASLGVTEGCAEGLHTEAYGKAAGAMLDAGTLTTDDKARLATIRDLLQMDEEAASRTLDALTSPLYTATVEEVAATLASGGAGDATKLSSRRSDLLLEAAVAAATEREVLRATATKTLNEAFSHFRAQSTAAGVEAVDSLTGFCNRASDFMSASGQADGFEALFANLAADAPSSQTLGLYRALVQSYLSDLKITAEQSDSLAQVATLLGLDEAQTTSTYAAAAGPLYKAAISEAVGAEGGPTDSAASELAAKRESLGLPAEVTTKLGLDVYGEKLKALAFDGKVLTEEDSTTLASLRTFLGLELESVYDLHEKACAPAYRSSVKEVMNSAGGAIPDEYFQGLASLRQRLCLSEDAARELFALEVQEKLKGYGQKAIDALQNKAKAQQNAKPGEAAGGGVEGAALAAETLALVEFALASKAITGEGANEEICTNIRNGCGFEASDLKEVYKQYLVEAFAGGDATSNQKIFDNLTRLALVLGLDEKEVKFIHNEIGSMIYRQYIRKALAKGGPLSTEDTTFLEQIKSVLGMEDERCKDLVRDQEVMHVSMLVEQMFEKTSVGADDVKSIRDNCDLFDVDLMLDLEVSTFKLERFFRIELEDMVESGELAGGDMGALEEVMEPFHVSEERASSILEETAQARANAGVLQAAASLRSDESDAAVSQIERMLKYMQLVECVASAPAVSEAERSELFLLYQASLLGSGPLDDAAQTKLDLLKSVMALPVAA